MDSTLALVAMSTPSVVVRYAAAFFFVVVAVASAYALYKGAKALERVDKVLADMDDQGIPLMQKAGQTLDGVNANLGNVDEITKDVAGITDKLDTMANAVEGAVSTPARKAAAFSAGVQSAMSSFVRRDKGGSGASDAPATPPPSWSAPAAQSAPSSAAATASDAAPSADVADDDPSSVSAAGLEWTPPAAESSDDDDVPAGV